MLWPALANGLQEVGLVPWGSSLFCVGSESDVSSTITEKSLILCPQIGTFHALIEHNKRTALRHWRCLWEGLTSNCIIEVTCISPALPVSSLCPAETILTARARQGICHGVSVVVNATTKSWHACVVPNSITELGLSLSWQRSYVAVPHGRAAAWGWGVLTTKRVCLMARPTSSTVGTELPLLWCCCSARLGQMDQNAEKNAGWSCNLSWKYYEMYWSHV